MHKFNKKYMQLLSYNTDETRISDTKLVRFYFKKSMIIRHGKDYSQT